MSYILTKHRHSESVQRSPNEKEPEAEINWFRMEPNELSGRSIFQWRGIKGTCMLSIRGFPIRGFRATATAALLALSCAVPCASARETNSTDVIVQLRLAGDTEALPP